VLNGIGGDLFAIVYDPKTKKLYGYNGSGRAAQGRDLAAMRAKVEAAYKAIVQFQADGHPVTYSAPMFLVSNLEDVKMSLIGAATQNAKTRAQEFAKNGNVQVGLMRSASQGSFYVLPDGASTDVDDAGWRSVVRDIENRTGYRIDDHRLELFGRCADCRADEQRT